MNTHILYRYCWQLPVLALLGLSLLPDVPWWNPVVGFWPLWLMAFPMLARVRSRQWARRPVAAARVSQVLVFPEAVLARRSAGSAPRKAA